MFSSDTGGFDAAKTIPLRGASLGGATCSPRPCSTSYTRKIRRSKALSTPWPVFADTRAEEASPILEALASCSPSDTSTCGRSARAPGCGHAREPGEHNRLRYFEDNRANKKLAQHHVETAPLGKILPVSRSEELSIFLFCHVYAQIFNIISTRQKHRPCIACIAMKQGLICLVLTDLRLAYAQWLT